LLRLLVERPFAALRVVLEAMAGFCRVVAVAPVFLVDFLRAAIVHISTPDWRPRHTSIAPALKTATRLR
jgi:hypothetical protein